jgi:hypothetical protein
MSEILPLTTTAVTSKGAFKDGTGSGPLLINMPLWNGALRDSTQPFSCLIRSEALVAYRRYRRKR